MNKINLPEPPTSGNFDSIDPIDGRYFDPEITKYLSERSRINYQAYIEAALAQTLAEYNICSSDIADEIARACENIDPEKVAEHEKTTQHDVKAIVNTIKESISDEAKPYVHFGATSYDIVATALSLQLKLATEALIIPRLELLAQTLLELANKYAETVQIGRTHGQHAVPITFGFTVSSYISRLKINIDNIKKSSEALPGKFSGAVGAYNALSVFVDNPQDFEYKVLDKIGLKPADFSTQIIPAENYTRLLNELNVAAGIMANISHDMRHLQRSEIAEISESFEPGQTGSSTMAHKRNPWNFENVISMSKQVSAQLVSANQNIVSEHQRDLTDSASGRYYVLTLALVAFMSSRLNKVMSKIEVDPESMHRNLYLTQGAIAAEPLYLLLEKYGHTEAHEVSKAISHRALEKNISLFEEAKNDQSIADYWNKFTDQEKQILSDPEKYYTGLAVQKTRQIVDKYS